MNTEQFYTIQDVAQISGLNREEIKNYLRTGKLKAQPVQGKSGTEFKIFHDSLQNLLEEMKVPISNLTSFSIPQNPEPDTHTMKQPFHDVVNEYKNLLQERQKTYQQYVEDLALQTQEIEKHYRDLLQQKDSHITTLMIHLDSVSRAPVGKPVVAQQTSDQQNIIQDTMEEESEPSHMTHHAPPQEQEEFEVPDDEPGKDLSIFFQQKLVGELHVIRKDLPGLFLNFFLNLADLNLYVELDPMHWKSFDVDEKKDTVSMIQQIYEKLAHQYNVNLENCEIRFMDPAGESLARYANKQMSII